MEIVPFKNDITVFITTENKTLFATIVVDEDENGNEILRSGKGVYDFFIKPVNETKEI